MEQQGGRLLLELPEEVLVHIFSFLQARGIYHVERVCKTLHRLTNDEGLWRVFCRRSWRNTRGVDRIEENQQRKNRWKRAFFYREHAERSWKAQGQIYTGAINQSFLDPSPIVIDLGTAYTKAGLANEDAPGVIVPTLVGRAKYKSGIVDMGQESIRSGHGAYAGRGILHLRRPMKNGIIWDWNSMASFYEHLFYRELRADPENHAVFIAQAAHSPSSQKHRIAEEMFGVYKATAIYIASQAVLPFYSPSGLCSTGVIVECGAGVTQVACKINGSIQGHSIGGDTVIDHMWDILRDPSELCINPVAERESLARVIHTLIHAGPGGLSTTTTPKGESLVRWERSDGKIRMLSEELQTASLELPFRPSYFAPFLFRGNAGSKKEGEEEERPDRPFPLRSIQELVADSITRCNRAAWKELCGNILLCGGVSEFEGFAGRLAWELDRTLEGFGVGSAVSIRKLEPQQPSTQEEGESQLEAELPGRFLVWQGAAQLSSQEAFAPLWVSKQDYEEYGNNILTMKFL